MKKTKLILLSLFLFSSFLFSQKFVRASDYIDLGTHTLNSLSKANIYWTTDEIYECEVMYSTGTLAPGGYSLLGALVQTAAPTNDGLNHYYAYLEDVSVDYNYKIRCEVDGNWVEDEIFQLDEIFSDFIITELGVKYYDEANAGEYFYATVKNSGHITVSDGFLILNFTGFDGMLGNDWFAAQVLPDGELSSPYTYYEDRTWEVRGPSVNQLDKNRNYEITAEVDVGDKFRESNEYNNTLTKTIYIGDETADQGIYDLEVKNITKNSATINWKTTDNLRGYVWYRKNGDNDNWLFKISDNYTTSHSLVLDNLASQTIYEFYINALDAQVNIVDKTENNNFTTLKDGTIKDKPDLTIQDIDTENSLIKVEYCNVGGNPIDVNSFGIETFYIKVIANGKIHTGISNNSNYIFSVPSSGKCAYSDGLPFSYFNLSGGVEYSVTAFVDHLNEVEESNENNNELTSVYNINEDDNGSDDNGSDEGSNDSEVDSNSTNKLVLQLQRQISALERQVINLEKKLTILDQKFAEKYAGTMFLDVENHGRLWYVDPVSKNRFYFENGKAALSIGSKLATGITYEDIQKIPVGIPDKLYNLKDSDSDGLPDRLESALGSDQNNSDTDGDGYNDKQELENGYNPINNEKYAYNQSLINRLEGKMLLQVSGPNSHGEIWYIHNGQRWYGGTEDSMYEIMKARSLGATAENIRKIIVGDVEGVGIDTDNDGLNDEEELLYATDINNPDTDGDGYLDGEEVDKGYNPRGEGILDTTKLKLISPNGGEVLIRGSSYTIEWENSEMIGPIDIWIIKDDVQYIDIGFAPGRDETAPTSFVWENIEPKGFDFFDSTFYPLPDGNNYKIKITNQDGGIFDISDEVFSIISQ